MHGCWLRERNRFYLPRSLKVVATEIGCFGFSNCYMWIMRQTNQSFSKHWSGGNDLTCITGSFYRIHLNTPSLYTKQYSGIHRITYVSAITKSLNFTKKRFLQWFSHLGRQCLLHLFSTIWWVQDVHGEVDTPGPPALLPPRSHLQGFVWSHHVKLQENRNETFNRKSILL